jgi:hypothetical protein
MEKKVEEHLGRGKILQPEVQTHRPEYRLKRDWLPVTSKACENFKVSTGITKTNIARILSITYW